MAKPSSGVETKSKSKGTWELIPQRCWHMDGIALCKGSPSSMVRDAAKAWKQPERPPAGMVNTVGRYTMEGRKLIQRTRQGHTLRRVLPVRGLRREARRTAVGSDRVDRASL